MDVIDVPLVWPTVEVPFTLELLRQRQRAGVVRQNYDGTYDLLFAGDLLRARASNTRTVGEIPTTNRIVVLDQPRTVGFGLDTVRPHRTAPQYEAALDRFNSQYGLIVEFSQSAVLVTRHEGLTETLSGTGGFECNGTPTHFFPEPRVSAGDPCPLWPACSGPGGARSTIRPA